MTKEERRRVEARRKDQKQKAMKAAVVALMALCAALVGFLLIQN